MPQPNEEISPTGVPAEAHVPAAELPVTETPAATTETPTTETPSTEEFDVNEFFTAKDAPLLVQEKPKVEEPKKEEEKVTVTPEEKTPVAEKVGQPLGKKLPSSRDYTGLPEDMVPLFQRMSNEAFEKFKPFYQEAIVTKQKLEELTKNPPKASGIPESYYEHPEAYQLTPEYSSAVKEADEAQIVLEHWRNQLDAVRQGETTYTTLARDPKTGAVVYGQSVKVDQRTQSQLEQLFFNSNEQANRFSQKLSTVKQSYVQKHQSALQELKKFEDETFTAFADPNHPMQPVIKDTISKVHPAFKNNPLTPFLAKAMISLQFMAKALQDKKAGVTPQDKSKAAAAKAGPTASAVVADAITKKGDDVTLDDFAKVKGDE